MVREIRVSRTADYAAIAYLDNDGGEKATEFLGKQPAEPEIRVTATLSNALLCEIAEDVQAILMDDFNAPGDGK